MPPKKANKKRKLRRGQAREKHNSRLLLLLMRDHGIPVETIIREYGYSQICKQNRVFEFIINKFLGSDTRVLPYSQIPYRRCVMTATMTSTMRTGGLSKLLDSFFSLSPILIYDKGAETITLHGDVHRDLSADEEGYWSHPKITVERKGSSDEETDEDELIELLKAPREEVSSSESEDEEMETSQPSSPRTQNSVMSQTATVTSQTTGVSLSPSVTSPTVIVTSPSGITPPPAAGTSQVIGMTSQTTSVTFPSITMTSQSTQVTSHPTVVTPAPVIMTSQCQQVTTPPAAMTSQSQVTSEAAESKNKKRKEKRALRLAAEAAHREVVDASRKLNLVKVRQLLAQFNFSPDVMVASVGHAAFTNLLRLYEVILSLLLETNCGKMRGKQLRKRACQINQAMAHSAPEKRLSLSNLEERFQDMAPIVKYYPPSDDVILNQKVYRQWMVDGAGAWVPRTVESEAPVPILDFGEEPSPSTSSGPSTSEKNDSGPTNSAPITSGSTNSATPSSGPTTSGPVSKSGAEPSWQDQSATQMEYCGFPECNKRQKFNSFILMEVMESVYDYSLRSMIARYGRAGMRKQLSLYEHIINSLLKSKYGALNHHLILKFYDSLQASKMRGHRTLLENPEECYSKLGSILHYRKDKGTVRLDDKFRKTVELKQDGFWNVIGDSKAEFEAKIQNRKYAENVAEGYATPNLLHPVRKVGDKWCPFEEENMARIHDLEHVENLQRRMSGLLPAKRVKLPDPQNCKSTMAVLSPPYRRVEKRSVSTNCTSDDIPKIPIIFRCWSCHQIPNEDVILDAVCGKLVGCQSCFSKQEPKYCPHCINIGKFVVLKDLHRKLWEMRHDDTGEV